MQKQKTQKRRVSKEPDFEAVNAETNGAEVNDTEANSIEADNKQDTQAKKFVADAYILGGKDDVPEEFKAKYPDYVIETEEGTTFYDER